MADYDLDYLLAQVRRIEEHREAGAETKIRRTYQKILKELRHYLADTYSQYAEDDKLTYDILQRHGRYARFLDEVEKKINDLSPETKRLIRSVVEQTYEHTYNGMIEAVKNTANDVISGLKGCTPAILRRAVENPVSKLTLNDRLEKHRKEIIYDIKQAITVGLVNGDRYSTMANRIKQSVDGSYKKAIRISRTETHRVREAGNLDAAESVQTALNTGDVPLQMMKVWKTMKDERVRPAKQKGKNKQYDHRKMDGVAVKIDEMFTLPSGAKTMAPGQSGVAGEDINCRCYLSYELRKTDVEAPAKQTGGKQYTPYDEDNPKDVSAAKAYRKISRDNSDVKKIAQNTDFTEKEVQQIKRHIFYNKHQKYDGYGMLYPDYDMAVAWKRLQEGKAEERDIILLHHELLESTLEKEYNLTITKAHKLAKAKYDWEKALTEAVGEDGERFGIL